MNVILKIQDREAIPVRAIPLLTNWEVLSPDELADALAGGEHGYAFHDIFAYRIEDKEVQPVVQTWWENFPCRALKALSDRIKATEISHETGYQEWRKQSLNELPEGVFVWKDEFESRYLRRYGRDGTTFMTASGNAMSEDEQQRRVALNFAPFIAEPEIRCLVLEGFGQLIAQSASRNLEQLWFVRGFYSASDNDTHWLGLHSLSPREAAALLCGRDPLVQRGCDDRCVVLLERRLTDYNETHPARRSWREWHDVAREIDAEYEKGFDEFFAELAQTSNTSTAVLPTQTAAPTAPVVDSASNAPLPLTTGDIAFCFDGIRWSENEWRRPLGDKPKWLQGCVVTPGQRGVSETRWNPVLIAAWLVSRGHVQARSARSRFQTKPQLTPWLEAWKTYEADNFDTP